MGVCQTKQVLTSDPNDEPGAILAITFHLTPFPLLSMITSVIYLKKKKMKLPGAGL